MYLTTWVRFNKAHVPVARAQKNIYVVVQFCPWFKFDFPSFLGMVIYDNELKQREINLNQG